MFIDALYFLGRFTEPLFEHQQVIMTAGTSIAQVLTISLGCWGIAAVLA